MGVGRPLHSLHCDRSWRPLTRITGGKVMEGQRRVRGNDGKKKRVAVDSALARQEECVQTDSVSSTRTAGPITNHAHTQDIHSSQLTDDIIHPLLKQFTAPTRPRRGAPRGKYNRRYSTPPGHTTTRLLARGGLGVARSVRAHHLGRGVLGGGLAGLGLGLQLALNPHVGLVQAI